MSKRTNVYVERERERGRERRKMDFSEYLVVPLVFKMTNLR